MSIETVKCLAAQAEQERLLELAALGRQHRAVVVATAERHPMVTFVAATVVYWTLPEVINFLASLIS